MIKYTQNPSKGFEFLKNVQLKTNKEILHELKNITAESNFSNIVIVNKKLTAGDDLSIIDPSQYVDPDNPETSTEDLTQEDLRVMLKRALKKTPLLSNKIFESLPKPLNEMSSHFEGRSRDIVLLSSLTILSGCFPTVYGIYDRKKVYAPLYMFIVAPPASDKSVMAVAKLIGEKIHEYIFNDTVISQLENVKSPSKAQTKRLFIPCDSSSAALIKNLQKNNGSGIMCETEADTMGNSLKQDWGSYSDLLRKAFHHEHIHQSRKKDDEFNEIKNPKLAVLLSGTPNQVQDIIKSAEDGLASRFGFYFYATELIWRDAFSNINAESLDDLFYEYGDCFLEIYKKLKGFEPINFEFTLVQKKSHTKYCERRFNEIIKLEGSESASSIMRLGLILYRLAMVLSIIRSKGNLNNNKIICEDEDYSTAELIMDCLIGHTTTMLKFLSTKGRVAYTNSREANLIKLLNQGRVYHRAEILQLWEESENKLCSVRSIDGALKKLCDRRLLIQDRHGKYRLK